MNPSTSFAGRPTGIPPRLVWPRRRREGGGRIPRYAGPAPRPRTQRRAGNTWPISWRCAPIPSTCLVVGGQQPQVEQRRIAGLDDGAEQRARCDAPLEDHVRPEVWRQGKRERVLGEGIKGRASRGYMLERRIGPIRVSTLPRNGRLWERRMNSSRNWPRSGGRVSPIAAVAPRMSPGSATSDNVASGSGPCAYSQARQAPACRHRASRLLERAAARATPRERSLSSGSVRPRCARGPGSRSARRDVSLPSRYSVLTRAKTKVICEATGETRRCRTGRAEVFASGDN